MMNRKSMFLTILLAAFALTFVGCLPSGGGGGNNGGGGLDLNNGGGNNGGGNNGGGNNGGGESCQDGDDCPIIYCNCTDGGVVNASRCDNNSCAPAADICPSACEQFGSEWDGTVSTLPEDDAGTEDAGTVDTGTSTDTGSDGPQCLDGQLQDNACGNCMDQNCCIELEDCFFSDSCTSFLQCVQGGTPESECAADFPNGQSLADAVASCQQTFCSSQCQ